MSTLNELNALRTAAGMKPLKSWKESKAKLDAAVAKLTKKPTKDEFFEGLEQQRDALVKKQDEASAKTKVATKTAKVAAKEPAKSKPAAAKKEASTGTTISTIAKKLGIDPKVARAKLRRAFGDADGSGKEGSRWEFTAKRVAEIEEILKGDARKKA